VLQVSISENRDNQPWENLPPEIQGALTALDERIYQLHITYGNAARNLCYSWLSGDWSVDAEGRDAGLFNEWSSLHPAISNRFGDLVTQNTPPSTVRAFFNFYIDMMAIDVLRIESNIKRFVETEDADIEMVDIRVRSIFAELVEIGREHEANQIAWAKAQAKNLFRIHRHAIHDWVCWACDRKPIDPTWQAPRFLLMKPAGNEPYDSDRARERMDAENTQKALESFSDEYERRLDDSIEDAAAAAYLKAAKHPKPSQSAKGSEPLGGKGGAEENQSEDAKSKEWENLEKQKNDPQASCLIAEVASLFEVSERTIRNRIERRKLPRHPKPGRAYVQTAIRLREPQQREHKKRRRKKL
jgi:hypothetical protein